MRTLVMAALAFAPALALGACADDGPRSHPAGYEGRTEKLQRDCDARGGTLAPTGRLTGEAPLDNVCRNPDSIPGSAGR